MVHTRPPHGHHWHISICPTVTPRLVFHHIRNLCLVSVDRRWQLASCQHPLQIACQPGVQKDKFCLCIVRWTCDWLWHYGFEVMGHPPYSIYLMPSDFLLFGPSKKLASVLQLVPTWRKLSPPGYRHLTPVSSGVGNRLGCPSGTSAKMSVVTVEVCCGLSDTHLPCAHWSQNEVLSITVFLCF